MSGLGASGATEYVAENTQKGKDMLRDKLIAS